MPILIAAALIAVIVGVHFYLQGRKKPQLHAVTHYGVPPPGIEDALDVIFANCPGLPRVGLITWESGPFTYTMLGGLAMGTVVQYKPFWHIRVTWDAQVERTALAHELGHVWSELTAKGFGESPQDKKFVEWFTDINAQIAKKLGR